MVVKKRINEPEAPARQLARQAILHYAQELRRYLRRRLRRPQDVDDLAQEVYLRLLRWDDAKVVEKPLAYLYGIASHVVADFHMAATRSTFVPLDDALVELPDYPAEDARDPVVEVVDIEQRLTRLLSQLPPTHAAIVIGFHREGLTYEEIATKLNLSANTVHKYLTQARAQLRILLAQDDQG